jgi:DNA-damage-inducible protein J
MSTKTASLSMRLDPDVKAESERLFSGFGMTLSEAINVLPHKSLQVGGLPFDVRQERYNAETEEAMHEARAIMAGEVETKQYASVDELFEDVGMR